MGDETTWWTDNTTQREMTLDEWCATLPEGHRARRELTALLARLAAARGENATALAAAERAGAERALRWAWNPETRIISTDGHYIRSGLAALFPPPGAEVGRG